LGAPEMLRFPGTTAKLATTDASALIVTAQLPAVPEHAPDQPVKLALPKGDATSVTLEPST